MRRTARARDRVAFALAVALAICVAAVQAAAVGQPAPAFALPAVDGSTLESLSLRGKVVLVDFWASWCGPCRQSFPFLDGLYKEHAAEGLVVVGVNLDEERGDADRFLAERPVSFTIVFDPAATVPPTFELKAMPSSYLIGRDGIVRVAHAGFRTGDADRIEAEVRALLAEKAP